MYKTYKYASINYLAETKVSQGDFSRWKRANIAPRLDRGGAPAWLRILEVLFVSLCR